MESGTQFKVTTKTRVVDRLLIEAPGLSLSSMRLTLNGRRANRCETYLTRSAGQSDQLAT
jgi:hypothetical protein